MKIKNVLKPLCTMFGLLLGISLQAAGLIGNITDNNLNFELYDDNTAIVFAARDSDGNSDIKGKVIIPGEVTDEGKNYKVISIGKNAFKSCTNITEVDIPNSVTFIGEMAFSSCTSLKSIIIPNSVTSWESAVFITCTSLASVVLPDKITTIPSSAFGGCLKLSTVIIPETVTSIGIGAFFDSGIESIVIPNNVKSIGKMAFRSCKSLASIVLGSGITTIDEAAFPGCFALREISSLNPNPPVCNGTNCFGDVSSVVLTIPLGSKELYKSAEVWNSFKKFAECFEDGTKACFLKLTKKGLGTILVNDKEITENDTLKAGSKAIIKIVNKTGGSIASIKLNGANIFDKLVDNTYTINTLNADARLEVEFNNTTYDVTVTYNKTEGSVKINNEDVESASIAAGDKAEFVIAPNAGYTVKQVTANDKDVTAELKDKSVYTIDALSGNMNLKVTFENVSSISESVDNGIHVYSLEGTVIIENIQNGERIFISNSKGQNVYSGTDTQVTLSSGIYVVKAGGLIKKVMVK